MSEQVRHPPAWAADASASWRAWLPSLPWIVGLLAMLRAVASPLALLHDPDTYLHIAAGRWMLAHGALPTTDPFSFTMAGARWVPHEWLAEALLAVAYQGGGWSGVVVLTAGSFALALAIMTRLLLRRVEPLGALVLVVAAAALLLPHLLARPHLLALPWLVLWCGGLLAARDDRHGPPWRLLPVMVLWANLHGSFLFGLAFAVFLGGEAVWEAAAGRARRLTARHWAGFAAAALVAALLTPNGLSALLQPFALMAMPTLQSTFAEWQSPALDAMPALEMWILGTMTLGLTAGVRLPPTRLALLLGLFYLSFQHGRHVDLIAAVVPCILAAPLGERLAAVLGASAGSSLRHRLVQLAPPAGLAGSAVGLAFAGLIALPLALRPVTRADDTVTPSTALAAAQRLALGGRVFNAEGFGGYLIFRGVPSFIDGRIEMYGDAFLADQFKAERGDPAVLAGLLDRYHIAWTLLSPASGAVAVLDHLPGWRRAYGDDRAVVHVRAD